MTGLDRILENIASDAKQQADEIVEAAKQEVKRIIDEASTEAGAECAGIVEATRQEAELLGKIAKSGAELNGRKLMLKTRRGLIDEIMAEAIAKLKKLPAEEYFAVLVRLAAKYAEKGEGEMILSAADKARVPSGFIDSVNSALSGGRLAIAGDTAETDGGFILRYGGIEENCTFDAIAEQERERLSDELDALLFS